MTLLAISGLFATLLPTAHAAEPNLQTQTQQILNDVVGLKTETYTASQSSITDGLFITLPQKQVDMTLLSAQSTLTVSCSFVSGTLQFLYFSNVDGQFSLKQPASTTVDSAKGFLERYVNYSQDSFYGELAASLNGVDANLNLTKAANGFSLEVLNLNQKIVDYTWKYIDLNGVSAVRKSVILSFDNGQLEGFWNNWPFYTVEGTPTLSSEAATQIAIEASKNFSYQVSDDNGTSTVSGFKVAPQSLNCAVLSYLNFQNASSARGGNPFVLYPSWYVPLGFDKMYPGSVGSMTVSIWADTGEISEMGPVVVNSTVTSTQTVEPTTTPQTPNRTNASSGLAAPIIITLISSALIISLAATKKFPHLSHGRKPFYPRFWAVLLCAIFLISLTFAASIPKAAASQALPNSKAEIYACVNATGYNVQQANVEETAASIWISGQIADAFNAAGYTTSDQSLNTLSSTVIADAGADEQNYDRTAVFWVGHRSYYGIQDSYNNSVDPDDIYPQTDLGNHFFVFLWVCAQATDPTDINGMPAAWTHRTNMSSDGFANPDGSGQCFISFSGFSPMISGYHQTFDGYDQLPPAEYFIQDFYNYTLYDGLSVKDALNLASNDYFGCDYASSPLNLGCSTWWPGGGAGDLSVAGYYPADIPGHQNDPVSRMQVFGDSNIKLYQPLVTIAALDYNTQKEFPVDVYVDGEYALTTSAATVDSFRVSPGVHNVTLSTNGTMHYYLINGTEVDQDNSLTYEFPYDTNVVALVDTGSTNSTWLYVPIFAAIFVAAAVIVGLLVITRRRRKQKTAKT